MTAWTTPRTWTTSELVTAAMMNTHVRDNLLYLYGISTAGALRKTTSKAVTNTIADTDLLNGEFTIAANAMGASTLFRLTAWGDWTNNTGASTEVPKFRVKVGSGPTTIIDTGVTGGTPVATDTGRYGWRIVVEWQNLGATNSQWMNFFGAVSGKLTAGSGANPFVTGEGRNGAASAVGMPAIAEGGNSSAIDTTAAQAFILSVVNPSSTATCETKLIGALGEFV